MPWVRCAIEDSYFQTAKYPLPGTVASQLPCLPSGACVDIQSHERHKEVPRTFMNFFFANKLAMGLRKAL
jgi:hypothetical protein